MSIPLIQSSLEIILGIIILFAGGEFFVQGAGALAGILGIPQLVIGLTVVSLGTSAPELFVSVGSFFRDSDAIAVGNVVGSNIFNVLVVLGSSALVMPLKVRSRLVKRDVPLLLAVSAAVWGMASSGRFSWQSGFALLIALIINTIWEIRTAREEPQGIKDAEPEVQIELGTNNLIKATSKIIAGILILALGSNLLISGAKSLASSYGWSETVIGLTIVSAGTSMPELITSIVASFRGKTDLAIGNVVGSSLLNQLLVLGSCALFAGNKGLEVEEILIQKDFPIMILTVLACMPIFWTKGTISRSEGALLLILYIVYLTDQIFLNSLPFIRLIIIFYILPLILILIIFKAINYWKLKKTI
ncbi:calcium/sodium antiporter [Prochlorococcus marinus]|uniref:Ca2+/Na+ antiporter n=1 Tax=Prochlorococcus marinus (strain SARG / CCMP1375 / SS120) TaxID=167539 RepID=Q7VD19_PROMA|nr:Ca2+/Na+ antiporter [Prochlorococcus marinus subsp. marinus str. CCMP1375]KGG11115.1 Inner membrane protein YrbG [Prochlorococcus marinus str. LG]KGG21453.1 Inner membrane protein YrbG [Prochlorococcus marinus str. SS2]KGG23202.1 Inner membrane protein YrbG [Prochlorococcus marinus str. SS35]KGG33913.1 Inner membrane protein YrbG [Prochlorococcus marinus str. SS51]KGG36738.1 Inner membrane protein YrbG [Prochlorococcus sp. SS52]